MLCVIHMKDETAQGNKNKKDANLSNLANVGLASIPSSNYWLLHGFIGAAPMKSNEKGREARSPLYRLRSGGKSKGTESPMKHNNATQRRLHSQWAIVRRNFIDHIDWSWFDIESLVLLTQGPVQPYLKQLLEGEPGENRLCLLSTRVIETHRGNSSIRGGGPKWTTHAESCTWKTLAARWVGILALIWHKCPIQFHWKYIANGGSSLPVNRNDKMKWYILICSAKV